MAAWLALKALAGEHSANVISSFLYRSLSVVSKYGSDASDIAILADLTPDDFDLYQRTFVVYEESMEWETMLKMWT